MNFFFFFKKKASLEVQGLRLHTPNAGGLCSIPDQGTRSHMRPLSSHSALEGPVGCSQDQVQPNKYF